VRQDVSVQHRAVCEVDLEAISANVEILAAHAPGAALMAVVKADAYGHGLVPSARAAIAGGADWLGTALLQEALALRQSGVTAPILTWLWAPGDGDLTACVRTGIDVTASAGWQLEELTGAAHATGVRARVQLKVDTGLGRNGCTPEQWPALVQQAAQLEASGTVRITGVWSHFALADAPSSQTNAEQLEVFERALDVVAAAGLTPDVRHIANSAATLASPVAHYDLVRPGIAVYGVSPGGELGPPEHFGLAPAMTLRARLAGVKRVPAGTGVSYGHEYVTPAATTLGLVPLGYADGIPRVAGGAGPVLAAGRIRPVAGRVCMDQFVLDLGDDPAEPGDEVVLFGSPQRGEPTAEDWAAVSGTIGYEIITRLGPRIHRTHVGAGAPR
jgi:alanine racemase